MTNGGDWMEYRRLVVESLERLEDRVNRVSDRVEELHREIALLKLSLKLKSGLWGAAAGAIPVILYLILRKIL